MLVSDAQMNIDFILKERARELGFKLNIYSDSSGTTIELYEM